MNLVFATRVLCLLIGGHRCCFHHHQLHDQLFTTYSAKRQQPTECSVPYKIRVNIPICGERSYIESLLNTSAPVGSPSLVILLPKKGWMLALVSWRSINQLGLRTVYIICIPEWNLIELWQIVWIRKPVEPHVQCKHTCTECTHGVRYLHNDILQIVDNYLNCYSVNISATDTFKEQNKKVMF